MKIQRLFVPLSTEPYNWFLNGSKKWELRRYGRQYTEKNVKVGKLVEFRCGYNNANKVQWGIIKEYKIFNTLEELYQEIPFNEILPKVTSIEEAIALSKDILNIEKYTENKFIIFRTRIIQSPEFIEMADEFYESIIHGKKTSTIRRGQRKYKIGKAIICFNQKAIIVNILSLKVTKLSILTKDELACDGFESISSLTTTLSNFYDNISENEPVTIVNFEIVN